MNTKLVIALVFLFPSLAAAGPPFTTNDADPPGLRQWEINLPITYSRAGGGSGSGSLLLVDVNYGYDRYRQLSVEVPVAYARPAGGPTRAGAGDLLLEYKQRFGVEAAKGYFGVNPQMSLPTADRTRGLGSGKLNADLPLIYQRRIGKGLIYTDLRYKLRRASSERSHWFWGIASELQVAHNWEIGAELFGLTANVPGGRNNGAFNVGFKHEMHKGSKLMFSIGRSLHGDPSMTVFFGLKVLTPS